MTIEACQDLLISLALRSTVLLGLVWIGLAFCQHRSANFRCGLLTAGLLALAILPFSLCLPRVEVALLPNWSSLGSAGTEMSAASEGSGLLSSLSSQLILAWFGGICLLGLSQSVGIWQLQRWKDRSQRLDSGYWRGLVEEVSESLGYRGSVRLYRCPMIHSPAAAGLFRPSVFLPESSTTWDAERLRIVLLHEMGHLKRRDLWTQWLGQFVGAVYWFHPFVWRLHRSLHQTREFACDHTVLRTGTEPSQYASHLLALAKNLARQPDTPPRLVAAQGLFLAMASPGCRQSALEQRVRAILAFRNNSPLPLALGLLLVAGGLAASWATATLAPASPEKVGWPAMPGGAAHSEPAADSPGEIHLRLTANPFPGNR